METHLEMRNQASESAEVLYEYIEDWIAPKSFVDVGCVNRAWSEKGLNDFLGLDGGYVDPAHLHIPEPHFKWVDLRKPVELDRRFDLAVSVEVAEHLPPEKTAYGIAAVALEKTGKRNNKP